MTDLLVGIPRVRLLNEPTELQRMEHIEKYFDERNSLFIKRDDSIPLGGGGNKLRSLEFWIGEAMNKGASVIVVAGNTNSNQCRLTAAASAKLGLPCHILYNNNESEKTENNLFLTYLAGAEIRFLGKVNEKKRAELAFEYCQTLERKGEKPYLIGDEATGGLGYLYAVLELFEQSKRMKINIKHVFLPGSMGTTEAGFMIGNIVLGSPYILHLPSVENSLDVLEGDLTRICCKISDLLSLEVKKSDLFVNVRLYDGYVGPGFAQPTSKSVGAIRFAASMEGLFLENTYSGKAFACMLDLLKKKEILADETVCFIHTGGVPALYSQTSFFSEEFIFS